MIIRPPYDPTPTRTTQEEQTTVNIDSDAAEIQKGNFQRPTFFGDQSMSESFQMFSAGINTAVKWAGGVSVLKNDLTESRGQGSTFRLTVAEMRELQRVAASIGSIGKIPEDVVEDFLIILCSCNREDDMKTIADAVQIAELANPAIMQKPMLILAINGLEKIAYAASAVEGLIHLFRKYIKAASSNANNSKGEDIGSILNALGGAISGFGGVAARLENNSSADALGNFMSELINGKRIPMTVIAKNPVLQAPSYIGKAFFGESPTALSNVDITQLFAKKIGAFPKPSNGAGTSSFGIQNMGSLGGSMSVNSLISKMLTGGSYTAGSKTSRMVDGVVSQINNLTGALGTETIDIRRADTAIPMMAALSTALSGTKKNIFSQETFKQAWMMSNAVGHFLHQHDSKIIEAVKSFT